MGRPRAGWLFAAKTVGCTMCPRRFTFGEAALNTLVHDGGVRGLDLDGVVHVGGHLVPGPTHALGGEVACIEPRA